MYEQFKTRAEAVSAEVHRFGAKPAALNFILDFLKAEGVADAPQAYALWADCPFLDGLDLPSQRELPGLKFQVTRELAAMAKFGISQAGWALADTGTLVQDSTAVEGRLVSTLTEIHIALLPTNTILPDMPTLLTLVHPDQSSYIAMITGPSRTADIERVLTIGVHGPSRLIIVCVDELGGAN
ncbi:MAG: lactate utilization protein [Geobacter sp.]|nr:lactate utilization protein [Geobacter sp.]